LFLRNHDELTLEMVTDEERDYMYHVYAQDRKMRVNLGIRRRLAPLLGNDRRRIELMNSLLFSLPGTPVIYYGDEIGMGDNFYLGDRNGVRTPMQWSSDRNAGFSRANPQRLYLPVIIDPEYHFEAINVEAQQSNPHSLLWWTKRLIQLRKRSRALSRGSLTLLHPDNRRVLAFVREYEGERVLVLANLSRFVQGTEIPLHKFQGMTPTEMFGHSQFPAITEKPYFVSLGPHAFFWFNLQPKEVPEATQAAASGILATPLFLVQSWSGVFTPELESALARLMPAFLRKRRWYLGDARIVRQVDVTDVIPLPESAARILLLRVQYDQGEPETYTLPLSVALADKAAALARQTPEFILARLQHPDGSTGLLYSALADPQFGASLLNLIGRRRRAKGRGGDIASAHTPAFRRIWGGDRPQLAPRLVRGDHNHSALAYGNRFFLKLFRKVEPDRNPELEVEQFLSQKAGFQHSPAVAGWLEYQTGAQEPVTLGILQGYIESEATAWQYTLDSLGLFFERALAEPYDVAGIPTPGVLPIPLRLETPPAAVALLGEYVGMLRVLGKRTAEMHLALATEPDDPAFAPEPFTDFYRHSLYHGVRVLSMRTLEQLRNTALPPDTQPSADRLLVREPEIHARLQALRDQRINVTRIRYHGDYHLGQVLHTGKDFAIVDFEGDPRRSTGQRRLKACPLRDVASMLRSLDCAAHSALLGQVPGVIPRAHTAESLRAWAGFWSRWACALFLAAYLDTAGPAAFLPPTTEQTALLLQFYLLEDALLELKRELTHRLDRVRLPVDGLLEILGLAAPKE
jgi:maltose alpha-D-glucosyltransferase/alpha-amylase